MVTRCSSESNLQFWMGQSPIVTHHLADAPQAALNLLMLSHSHPARKDLHGITSWLFHRFFFWLFNCYSNGTPMTAIPTKHPTDSPTGKPIASLTEHPPACSNTYRQAAVPTEHPTPNRQWLRPGVQWFHQLPKTNCSSLSQVPLFHPISPDVRSRSPTSQPTVLTERPMV